MGNDYLTAAITADGTLAVAYMPTNRTITVAMSRMRGATTAQWIDPTNGTYQTVPGSPFANVGTRQFTTPQGQHTDWVLVLNANVNPTPTPTATPTPNPNPNPNPTPAPGPYQKWAGEVEVWMQQNAYTSQQVQFVDSFIQFDPPHADQSLFTYFNYWLWDGELKWSLRNEGSFSSAQVQALDAFIHSDPPYIN